jgi:hypothetical protein
MAFPCKADVVWSDNFDDGNYNGWFVSRGAFSADDKTLRTVPGYPDYILYCPSYVTTGTWSFDMLVGPDARFDMILYEQSEGKRLALYLSGINIVLRSFQSITPSLSVQLAAYNLPRSMTGWQHFDVTRDSDGRTCVYNNGTLVIDVIDTTVMTSEFIRWISKGGAIDNIVVSNTIDIEPPPQIPFYMQIWFLETVGAIALAVAVIIIFLGRRKH